MRKLLLVVAVAALSACQNLAFMKADDAAMDMEGAQACVTAVLTAATGAQQAYENVLTPSAKLRDSFKAFEASVGRFDASTETVKRAIESVEKRANAFLASYAKQREEIKNPDLRAAMLMRREAIERQITDMKVEFSSMLAAADSLSRELQDLRIFFAASLNEQAVGSAAVVGDKLKASIANLDSSERRVVLELADLAASLSSTGGK